ncbi:hypothetical protein BGP77_03910 [Saccharospirillum sp. MSK14-1]|uniref:hypothetical protein n=1 Tax=Saccharospirillum sp. MSK14-1 TaxID=1897632 RepID=UPI000D3CA7D7|nr:hypothetical protein [Saccharospirillum sp. MSK14-1]PTY36454.1 hypothetical protein BGP77_03910 [Saccharospirillum sp. MSK14-1]
MKLSQLTLFLFVILFAAGCATRSANTMTTTVFKDGTSETIHYTKDYVGGSWVIEGEIVVEVWLEHDKQVGPFYGLQQSMGWLGPSDLEANAGVSVYLVNFTDTPREVTDLKVVYGFNGVNIEAEEVVIELIPRSYTQVLPGTITIPNYRRQVGVISEFTLDGSDYSVPVSAIRLTAEGASSERVDFPWFKPPYYPFDPPLTQSNF